MRAFLADLPAGRQASNTAIEQRTIFRGFLKTSYGVIHGCDRVMVVDGKRQVIVHTGGPFGSLHPEGFYISRGSFTLHLSHRETPVPERVQRGGQEFQGAVKFKGPKSACVPLHAEILVSSAFGADGSPPGGVFSRKIKKRVLPYSPRRYEAQDRFGGRPDDLRNADCYRRAYLCPHPLRPLS